MRDVQKAAKWWMQLFSELGTSANARSPGPLGEAAKHRVKALRSLFFSMIATADVDRFMEIGAYNAEASKKFASLPGGKAYAYEANVDVFESLQAKILLDNVNVFNVAVGNKNGYAKFYSSNESNLKSRGSLKQPSQDIHFVESHVVIATLDSLASKVPRGVKARDTALWVDVCGGSCDVLESGRKALKTRVALVFVEANDTAVNVGDRTSFELIDDLLSYGFVPVARDNHHANSWNLVCVHESLFSSLQSTIVTWFYKHSGNNHVADILYKRHEAGK